MLESSFSVNAECSMVRSTVQDSIWLSPDHWSHKPFAQVLAEATPKDCFDAGFPDSCLSKFSNHAAMKIMDISLNEVKIQSSVYRVLVLGAPCSKFHDHLLKHNMRPFRKLKIAFADQLCDIIVQQAAQWPKLLRGSKCKYGVLGLLKFCTDTFCTPSRFGQLVACPFCKIEGNSFSIAHVSKCADFMTICTASMQQTSLDKLLQLISSPELIDKRFWLLWLTCNLAKSKYRKAIIDLFATISLAIASGVNEPTLTWRDRVSILKTLSL